MAPPRRDTPTDDVGRPASFSPSAVGIRQPPMDRLVVVPDGATVRVRGAGFYDFNHGQTGRSQSCMELHPLTSIERVRFLRQAERYREDSRPRRERHGQADQAVGRSLAPVPAGGNGSRRASAAPSINCQELGIPELVVVLITGAFWLVPVAAGVWDHPPADPRGAGGHAAPA